MDTLKKLIEREQNVVDRINSNFCDRVNTLYELEERLDMSATERAELTEKVKSSERYERELRDELDQVRKSIKRHILKLLGE